MTAEELAQKLKFLVKDARKREWPFLGIYLLGAIGIVSFFTGPAFHLELNASAVFILIICWFVIPFPILGLIYRKRVRALGLHCPACDTSLAEGVGQLAVQTLYCCQCGSKILDDEETQSDLHSNGHQESQNT